MLKQSLTQGLKLQQKLSPLQIQTIKLLEIPTLELEQKIRKELEENPVLDDATTEDNPDDGTEEKEEPKKVSISEYSNDDIPSYKLYINNRGKDEEPRRETFSVKESLTQSLINQLGYRKLTPHEELVAKYIIGSLDTDGYLRRAAVNIADDIDFRLNVKTTPEEVERILCSHIQQLDPVGVGARDLRECLLLQINAKQERTPAVELAQKVLDKYFDEFTKKHFDKITSRLGVSQEELKEAIEEIVKLNPKPGGQVDDSYSAQTQQIAPDFVLENDGGKLTVTMPKVKIPKIKVKREYEPYLDKNSGASKESREASSFVKRNYDNAKWFMEAIKQRQNTLQSTMEAIVEFQKDFFLEGDETLLKPMILKNIAEKTGLDISTISRVVNSKYIQTPLAIYPLKYFFSEAMATESGEEVSSREIKKILKESIETEDKTKPLTDEQLVNLLKEKGYLIARRTVAKYREQLSIPVARLRKSL